MPSLLSLAAFAGISTLAFPALRKLVADWSGSTPPFAGWLLTLSLATFATLKWRAELSNLARFAWACFLAPLGKEGGQKGRLDQFYRSQAEVYDATRNRLLRGRHTMLKLSVAHLLQQRRRQPGRRLVWVDIGGGTGWNIEEMHRYCPIDTFDAIYLIDLCEPLLEVARKRFADKGWKNVHVLCQDATQFTLPEWNQGEPTSVDFVTLSYSLSMMPNFYAVVDRIDRVLEPAEGIVGVVDFYVSGRERAPLGQLIGDVGRHCGFLTRLFWLHWFEFDHVDLHPSRRAYLEYTFGTIKSVNARNTFVPWLVEMCVCFKLVEARVLMAGVDGYDSPYYIGIFTKADKDVSAAVRAFEVDSGNLISTPSPSPVLTASPSTPFSTSLYKNVEVVDGFSLGAAALPAPTLAEGAKKLSRSSSRASNSVRLDVAGPLSSFHYQLHKHFRLPYLEAPEHKDFRTWIYGFTWEDPFEDMKHLDIGAADEVLAITSAGDNLLHYAIAARPRRLYCVDMNPAQNALLELKLACISALDYSDFWNLFGLGKHPKFRELLDLKIAPYLSSHGYQFWRQNASAFDENFYLRGYSGIALRAVKWALWLAGVGGYIEEMCEAPTIEAQRKVWKERIMPVMTSRWMTALVSNPLALPSPLRGVPTDDKITSIFMWNALGVPMNQARMFLNETKPLDYGIDTMDPVASTQHMSQGAYWYYLCLMHRYSQTTRPLYLTPEGFAALKRDNGGLLDHFRLHTDSLINVLKQLPSGTLTVAVIMDAQDWFDPSIQTDPTAHASHDPPEKAHAISSKPEKPCQLRLMIAEFGRVLKPGGRVFWRSAAMHPWYAKLYEAAGFQVEPVAVREIGTKVPIDGVNMYASLWKATKAKA